MANSDKKIIVRFPPSPTGNFHIGGARTALYNYLFAQKNKGKIVLRFEDTDKERSKKEYELNIQDGLNWLGFTFDDVSRQSERTDVYRKHLADLIKNGNAYLSKEIPKNEGDRAEVIRFKNPNIKIEFDDLIRGKIEFDTTELGDFVIARNLEEPLYHLAVVIDDFEMGITHVIRGEDHISNTPRQILIQRALHAPQPTYAHIPLILAPDRSKLSKRHGSVALTEYRERGYLPEAVINYLALLGWNPGGEQEIFTLPELIEKFDLSRVQKGGAIFNEEKLKWINKEHIARLSQDRLVSLITRDAPHELVANPVLLNKVVGIIRERMTLLSDVKTMRDAGELDYYFKQPKIEAEKLLWKDEKETSKARAHLDTVISLLKELSEENFTKEKVKEKLWPYAEKAGRGNVLWPTRYGLSGKDKSPDPFALGEILGKAETIKRLEYAHHVLSL